MSLLRIPEPCHAGPVIAAYLTGHGFGHTTRLCEVLAEVRRRAPGLPMTVVGAVPEALVRAAVGPPLELRPVACDVGLVQRDALEVDEPASEAAALAFDAGWAPRLEVEVAFLRHAKARLVVGDVPPLAFAAARRAGLPSVAISNFGWDWIYRHLSARLPGLAGPAERASRAYAEADLLLELPFAGGLDAFPRRIQVGLVARRPRVDRAEARRRLGLDGRPTALLSFGGVGLPGLGRERLDLGPDLAALLPEDLPPGRLQALGLGYVDVVGAADVVVTKPGYGMVSDAIAAGTPLVYTERGDFPEYPVMVREMPALLACLHVGNEAVRAGRLDGPIRWVLELPRPPAPDLGGAARAAERILALLS
jgi:L-arabinokinase